ncbi:hypothetical protein BBF96_11030 [Anoxybacter fermentans]|uniref:Flagellar hook capping protein n=1 Tax=Anoxybacter fermentans TaxID=1323375 RepID=A0A3Q9HRA8_9FIRM|nr:flagellar hook assembly protein FlgD [Anoxybacter fermentans]AZR73874.1 hypothetical protein BBF96_11030 [Anoxybacter fermentans]
MEVNQINNVYGIESNIRRSKNENILGKDEFLKLLVTQLRYQDPLNPMEDREFIAQTAQFSALEQMWNINQNLSKFMQMQAIVNTAALIGKEVTYLLSASADKETQVLSGVVTEVKFEDGSTYIKVNGENVPIEHILSVKEYTSQEAGEDSKNDQTQK